ncbi:28S ribosomal protein S22, mitochondrial [Sitophilus oryzae]|uniref:28S ribosomal protein S22, mitochondrial n=1 Tax=Sitophilus oryzae TaxID=7048 RepID=A0A6J2Y3Q3_SITOR|nr:28S ribosomal protein S22, mitochondrial [Sitophilus oryzae]
MCSLPLVFRNINTKKLTHNYIYRSLVYSSIHYDGKSDPGPLFFNEEVQSLLKLLTRIDYNKVFRKRKLGTKLLTKPDYQFMTDEQLKESINRARKKADVLLQIPPVVKVKEINPTILSKDSALKGLLTSKIVFTDITFGVQNADRIIVVRETDGTLQEADWQLRKRINQTYFPENGRLLKPPTMFQDTYLENLLDREEHEFVLDRACIQFDPDEPEYQRISSITYQHINEKNLFHLLRSTRHFGSLVFFLVWNKNIDNLLLDLIETSNVNEAAQLIALYSKIHNTEFDGDTVLEKVESFTKSASNKKGALELAIQAYKEVAKSKEQLEKGVNAAHGITEC